MWNRRTGQPVRQRHRVAGHPRPTRIAAALPRDGGPGLIRRQVGPAAGHLLLRRQAALDAGDVDGAARRRRARASALFGTMDTWLLWNLTGGTGRRPRHRRHQRQPHHADGLATLDWDDELLRAVRRARGDAPGDRASLARAPTATAAAGRSAGCRSPASWATSRRPWSARRASRPARPRTPTAPATSCCSTPAPSVRVRARPADHRVLPARRPAARSSRSKARSRSTGRAVQWLRDQLGIISGAADSEDLAAKVDGHRRHVFRAAFSGLFAPYWRADARGAIVGLSRFHTNAHLARATLEAICYQTRDVVEAMAVDSASALTCSRSTAASPPTTCACSCRRTSSACRSPARWWPRPPRSAPPTRPGWPSDSGAGTGELRATGGNPAAGSRPGPRTAGRPATPAGSKAVQRTLDWVDVDQSQDQ